MESRPVSEPGMPPVSTRDLADTRRGAQAAAPSGRPLGSPATVRGYSPAEIKLLQDHAAQNSARIAEDHRISVALVAERAARLLRTRVPRLVRHFHRSRASTDKMRWLERLLEDPERQFSWQLAYVEDRTCYHLGDKYGLAVDVVQFLARAENTSPAPGRARLPSDLVDEFVFRLAVERCVTSDAFELERLIAHVFDRPIPSARCPAVLKCALAAFVHARVVATESSQAVDERAAFEQAFASRPLRLPIRAMLLASAGALPLVLSLGWAWIVGGPGAFAGLRQLDPRPAWGLAMSIGAIAVGIAMESQVALFAASLLGVPLELPMPLFGDDVAVCRRRSRWLARFLSEPPRGYNTAGAHLAYGLISVKRAIKALCLRREKHDEVIVELVARRSEVAEARRRAHDEVIAALARSPEDAAKWSRNEHSASKELAELGVRILRRRLQIQGEVSALFCSTWGEECESGDVRDEEYGRVRAELLQHGEAHALLPAGLVRSPLTFFFEYSMFAGRLIIGVVFLATMHVSFLPWAAGLLLLQLYVVEPVVANIHIEWLDVLLQHPGHALADVRSHIEAATSKGGAFRVPIFVPKFSSNPAWAGLNGIIRAAVRRCGIEPETIVPFAMREGKRNTVIRLRDDGDSEALRARTAALRDAIAAELRAARSRFPLATEVRAGERCVIVSLVDGDKAIWDMVGEDAGQVQSSMRRSLEALRDSLDYLGPGFRPVFVLVSNTRDLDAAGYELESLRALQALSDREYGGQVGFLYLRHLGAWFDFAPRRRFDPSDKELQLALTDWPTRLRRDDGPAQACVADALEGARDAKAVARALNGLLADPTFPRHFDVEGCRSLPPHRRPPDDALELLDRHRREYPLSCDQLGRLNRELLATVLPVRHKGGFFKKVGNDIAAHELWVLGKTRPVSYTDRRSSEYVRDPDVPNFVQVWGDFERYAGLEGTNEEICRRILAGEDVGVAEVPAVGAVLDDKNEFAPGEVEKALAIMLHPANAHIVIGVPQVEVTLPRKADRPITSEYIRAVGAARIVYNAVSVRARARLFDSSSPAYGKWWLRPESYVAHYTGEVLNPAHALSHDFQQSYFVAGAAGRLAGFSEALCGPSRFRVRSLAPQTLGAPSGGGNAIDRPS